MYQFLNWCFKLEDGQNNQKLKGLKKVSALKGDK
jgi:hypothetical protein